MRCLPLLLMVACAHRDHELVVVSEHPSDNRFVLFDDGQVFVRAGRLERSFKLGIAEFARVRRILLDPKLFEMHDVVPPRDQRSFVLDGGWQQFELRDGDRHNRFLISASCEASRLPEPLAPACHLIRELKLYPRSEPLVHPGEREHRRAMVEMIEDYVERPTQTFWLLDDGEVIVREFRWDADYRSFKLDADELERVLAVLQADELFQLDAVYGPLPFARFARVSPAADTRLRWRRNNVNKEITMREVPLGQCQVDDFPALKRNTKFAPAPLVRACELIRQLQHDPRATPWFR